MTHLSAGEDSEVESDEKSGETDDKEEKQSKIGKQDKEPEGEDMKVEKDSGEEEEVAGGTQVCGCNLFPAFPYSPALTTSCAQVSKDDE